MTSAIPWRYSSPWLRGMLRHLWRIQKAYGTRGVRNFYTGWWWKIIISSSSTSYPLLPPDTNKYNALSETWRVFSYYYIIFYFFYPTSSPSRYSFHRFFKETLSPPPSLPLPFFLTRINSKFISLKTFLTIIRKFLKLGEKMKRGKENEKKGEKRKKCNQNIFSFVSFPLSTVNVDEVS